ncbi:MAG TPA: glycosyltransferase family 4 protein [Candidatus Eisenbacteria bacterium]
MPDRPRVLVVGPLPPPLGGVQLLNEMLLGSSLARDFELSSVNTSKGVLRWAVEKATWRTVPYFFRDVAALNAALARARPDVVVVHAAPSPSILRDWVFMLLARAWGSRVVCHYHGTLHTRFPSAETAFGRAVGRTIMRAAHRVIVLGPTYRERFAAAWGRDDIAWAPNVADVALLQSVAGDAGAPWLGPGERGVLFMGRLSRPKGIEDLFEAIPAVIARHPEARILLCGVAETAAQEPRLRAEVARRGYADRVTFLGSLEGREKARVWAAASVFVAPSWTEAFPLVIPEAMAAGVPMVVTAVGAIPDFVRDGEDGFLVPAHDPPALADRVCRLLDDEALRRRIAARLRERAPREFDIEVGAARVRAVLEGLLDTSAGASRARASAARG